MGFLVITLRKIAWTLIVASVVTDIALQMLTGDGVHVQRGEEMVIGEKHIRAGWYRASTYTTSYYAFFVPLVSANQAASVR